MKRFGAHMLFLSGLLLAGTDLLIPAQADTTAYKCTAANGQVTYQGAPCAHGQKQQTLQLQDDGPASSPPLTPVNDVQPSVAVAPPPPPRLPATPPVMMYRCTRATDGKTYLSNNGNPQPYYAPLAMTGILPTSIGQNYGGRVTPNAAMVASHYTLMQDQCQAMTPQDTCATLRSQYDENEQKLSRAFKSDQPPLLQRESELLAQLKHC